MKCPMCSLRVGKRFCAKVNQLICTLCCGSTRNNKECPINCNSFPEYPEPDFMMKNAEAISWETGDSIHFCEYLFLPNLYDNVQFELLDFDLFYKEPQKLHLTIEFLLKKDFVTDVNNILCKESWKADLYPKEDDELLYPLIGISIPGKGLFSLTKENINLQPSNKILGSVTHRVIISPNQRSLILGGKSPSDVNYLFARNLFIFSKLLFNVPYTLEIKLFDISDYDKIHKLLNTLVGLIIPFGKCNLIYPCIISPPGFSKPELENRSFLPITRKYYPGETQKGLSFISCKGNEHILEGKEIDFRPGNINKGPFLYIWGINNLPNSEISISLLDHDKVVNPLLLPIFKRFYGDISVPVHINAINFGIYKRLAVECTDLTSGKIWRETFAVPTKSEINVPLSLSGLSMSEYGEKHIKIEVSYAGNTIFVTNIELNILPPEHLLLRVHDIGHSWYRDTLEGIACWVTPNNQKINDLISDTANRIGNNIFSDKKPAVAQIKALWDQLKIRNMSFNINSYSIGTSARASYQRISIPETTLTINSGNCLDLTLVFASALEKLSLEPIIVLIDEHAFLGCKIDDKNTIYLETTYIEHGSFGQALKKGKEIYETDGWKKELIISQCRKEGFNSIF